MNKKDVITKEDIEKYYSENKRKIKFSDDIQPKDIEEIFELIKTYKESEKTFYKNGKLYCEQGRMRSIDDYIQLCKYYFPKTNITEILNIIKTKILVTTAGESICIEYCGNIRKDNIRKSWYHNPEREVERFERKSFSKQGFPNCNITYSQLT